MRRLFFVAIVAVLGMAAYVWAQGPVPRTLVVTPGSVITRTYADTMTAPTGEIAHQFGAPGDSVASLRVGHVPLTSATAVVSVARSGGAHAFFDTWAADPRTISAHSLRSQDDINSVVRGSRLPAAPAWTYDAAMDAARGTVTQAYPSDAAIRPHLAFYNMANGIGTMTWVWDAYIPASWSDDPVPFVAPDTRKRRPGAKLPEKAFQVRHADDQIHLETRLHSLKNQLPNIAAVDWRKYGAGGPGTFLARNPYGNFSDTVQPLLARYLVQADTWTRFILHRSQEADGYDYWSLWVVDEHRPAVQLYDRIAMVAEPKLHYFEFEFDSSQMRSPDLPPEWLFGRNQLTIAGLTNVAPLLVAPMARVVPPPPALGAPSNLRILRKP